MSTPSVNYDNPSTSTSVSNVQHYVNNSDNIVNMNLNDDIKITSCDNEENGVITLTVLNSETQHNAKNDEQVSHGERPSTPIQTRKYLTKRPFNLNLKINQQTTGARTSAAEKQSRTSYAETDNSLLSSLGMPTPALTPTPSTSTSATTSTATSAITTIPQEHSKNIKKLNIGFENIKYTTKTGLFRRESKRILNELTGHFNAGELSAIVGPSGAGKSTLLNILSSYTTIGSSGNITINGRLRDIKTFKPNVAFITQDTSLQPYLTVKEAMHFSANLKIGNHMTKSEKRDRVRAILEAIGMYENRHIRTGNLSGGQKKRLAIALELVSNPPVLILDEPTSGLDSSTSNQCISLLKKLALEGRTVICTIHQPSALTFGMFDHLYAIAEGRCIYSGGTQNLVPFLAECGLECPESYNPADYLMEIATNDYGVQNYKLVDRIQNGQNDNYRQGKSARKVQLEAMSKIDKMMASGLMTPVTAPIFHSPQPVTPTSTPNYMPTTKQQQHHHQQQPQLTPIKELSSRVWDSKGLIQTEEDGELVNTKEYDGQYQIDGGENNDNNNAEDGNNKWNCCKWITPKKSKKKRIQMSPAKLCKRKNIYATPFYKQLHILLVRTFLILWRDSSLTTLRFVMHFITALLIGFIYFDIGDDAANTLNNFRYIFYTIMFVMYCAFSAILVKFPLEFPIVSREHFNRWYSLRAYYIAITLADIPMQVICTSLFIVTSYWMTGQPLELYRILLFSFIVFLTALVAQSIGLAVGASLSVQMGAILGPFFICPFLTFSGFFLQRKDSPVYLRWVFDISFLKYSLDGSALAIFGYDRPKLKCTEMYCHYVYPKIFLKDIDMSDANYEKAVICLFIIFIGLRIISFYIMSFRLRLFRNL